MKKITFTALTVVLMAGMAMAQTPSAQNAPANVAAHKPIDGPAFRWEKTTYDFGKVPQNKPVAVNYTFTNAGTEPLIITNVHVQCGCTAAEFTKEVVAPGKKGFVKLTFNAAALGVFQKSVTVRSNASPAEMSLTFNGEVVSSEAALK